MKNNSCKFMAHCRYLFLSGQLLGDYKAQQHSTVSWSGPTFLPRRHNYCPLDCHPKNPTLQYGLVLPLLPEITSKLMLIINYYSNDKTNDRNKIKQKEFITWSDQLVFISVNGMPPKGEKPTYCITNVCYTKKDGQNIYRFKLSVT